MKKKLILLGIVLSLAILIVINFNSFKKVGENISYFVYKAILNNLPTTSASSTIK